MSAWRYETNERSKVLSNEPVVSCRQGSTMPETTDLSPPDPVAHAHALLNGRYAGLRRSGAEGWYAADHIPENLEHWSELLGPLLAAPGRMVELGCGAGNLALALAVRRWRVAGIDVSSEAIEWARSRAEDVGIDAEFEARDLGVPLSAEDRARFGGTFDLAVDADVLHYVLGDRRAVHLANARAMLAPGGSFVVRTIANAPDESDWAMLGYDPATRIASHGDVPMTYHGGADAILDELRAAGFAVIESRRLPRGEAAKNDQLFAVLCADPRWDRE